MLVYKILRQKEYSDLHNLGSLIGSAVDILDGYVHLSTAEQLPETLRKHYAGEGGLHLLALEDALLGGDLRWEPSRGGALFPHLYRELRLADILWKREITLGHEGHETGSLE